MTGRLDYNGSNAQGLDSDIIYTSEDSVILVYRKDWTEPWREYSDYTRLKVTPNDRRGFMRLDRRTSNGRQSSEANQNHFSGGATHCKNF